MSIKEEVEWFRPEDKLPVTEKKYFYVMFIHDGALWNGVFEPYTGSKGAFRDFTYTVEAMDVKYWAYPPEGPKDGV